MDTTKFVLISDLHLSEENEETVFSILSYVASYRDHNTKVAILGDFYDTVYRTGSIDVRLQKRVYDFLSKNFTPDSLYMIPGNHDMFSSFPGDSALSIFKSVATVYDTPTLDDYGILWLPYKEDGYERCTIQHFKRLGCRLCFTHNDFKCLHMRKGLLSQDGMHASIFEGISVYNGHYHYRNKHMSITCIGSIYAVHKTETIDEKRLTVLTVKQGSYSESSELVRFGRRNFVYPMDYCRDLAQYYWKDWVSFTKSDEFKSDAPPATYPTIQDTLTVEYEIGDDISLKFLENVVECPVVLRKKNIFKTSVVSEIKLDESMHYNASVVTKALFDNSEITSVYANFMKHYKDHIDKTLITSVSNKHTRLIFSSIRLQNFCGVKDKTISFPKKNDSIKIEGENGVGKTVQYPTALIYALSGVIDSRFSEERMLVSDLGTDCLVTLNGLLNKEPFVITRGHTGKKSKLTFELNTVKTKFPTVKQTQHLICRTLFNMYFSAGTCPQKGLLKVLLQRIVWKQGGKDSNFLKLSKDARLQTFLDLFNKNSYTTFEKYIKGCLGKENKKLEKYRGVLMNLKVRLSERKNYITREHIGSSTWQDHRRSIVDRLKKDINELKSKDVPYPQSLEEVSHYVSHTNALTELRTTLQNTLKSTEGLRWKPEMAIIELRGATDDLTDCNRSLESCQCEIDKLQKCMTLIKTLKTDTYTAICSLMKNYESKINLLETKTQQLEDGKPMKYLSGGEYEKEGLLLFLDYQKLLKEYKHWSCNIMIFDEPGTAMSTASLQSFVDRLPDDKCVMVISHKNIKCSKVIKL